jgi:p-aminobenzoyl-glutamate transporter AbgT
MGDSKRRKDTLGEKYGQEAPIVPWLSITKSQANLFVQWTTRGAWAGIVLLVAYWVTIRFVGPSFGWWQVN